MPRKASFDVTFAPVVNVITEVSNPKKLTGEEITAIVELASEKIGNEFTDKISGENLEEIRLYQPDMDKSEETSDEIVWGDGDKEHLSNLIRNARASLKRLSESTYIPFASPSPSSTEHALKVNILRALECLDKAIELDRSLYRK